jgi:hypothetical protein
MTGMTGNRPLGSACSGNSQQYNTSTMSVLPTYVFQCDNMEVNIFQFDNMEVDIFQFDNMEVNIFQFDNMEVDIFQLDNMEVNIFRIGNMEVDILQFENMEVDIETSDLSIETNGRSLKAPSKWEIV